ncbi:hypothetical protein J4216_02885 [Candidatus Woesearchaeota archaeon]|nr:hypothetical protein [Candidatus Woesearchaeota archaeon]
MFNNKRGIGQEIDWIIALGLFLITLVFMFILFRPGLTPVYDSDTLLDIVQDGFMNDINKRVNIVPIFLYHANESIVNEQVVLLTRNSINVSCNSNCATTPFNNRFTTYLDNLNDNLFAESYYAVKTPTDNPPNGANFLVSNENPLPVCNNATGGLTFCGSDPRQLDVSLVIAARAQYNSHNLAERDNQTKYRDENNGFGIPGKFFTQANGQMPDKTKYYLMFSDIPINFDTDSTSLDITGALTACLGSGNTTWPYDNQVAALCPVIYDIGIEESLEGIDLASFMNLNNIDLGSGCTIGYGCIKEKWGFPDLKEFIITVEALPQGSSNVNVIFPSNNLQPPENVQVFVRNFNSFLITDDGVKIPVKVRIKTW